MLALIRVRGTLDINPKIKKTLKLLMLAKANQLVLLEENKVSVGMIDAAKDYVTFGQIDKPTCGLLLEKRGRLLGDKKITKEFLAKHKISGFEALAEKAMSDLKKIRELGIKPVFRLTPPSKGFERGGIKKSFKVGGALGNRGSEINKLIEKMV